MVTKEDLEECGAADAALRFWREAVNNSSEKFLLIIHRRQVILTANEKTICKNAQLRSIQVTNRINSRKAEPKTYEIMYDKKPVAKIDTGGSAVVCDEDFFRMTFIWKRGRATIALSYHCVSLTDIYWVKIQGETEMAFDIYAANHDLDTLEECLRIDKKTYYGMSIIDYLVGNTDRHPENWRFIV